MINKRFFILMIFTVCIQGLVIAQKPIPQFDGRHKNVFVELGGPSAIVGAHFDMRLKKGTLKGPGVRAGIGGVQGKASDGSTSVGLGFVTFPLEFNYTTGQRRSSFISSIGILPMYATATVIENNNITVGEGFGLVGGYLNMGYRLQPLKNSVMFQLVWAPMILRGSGLNPFWFGLGLGFGFK